MDFVIRRQSEKIDNQYSSEDTNNTDENYDYRKWEWGYLRTECENLFLETFYNTYIQRLQRSFLSIFLVIHTIVGIVHIIVLVASHTENSTIVPEVYCYLASICVVWITLIVTLKESIVLKYPRLPLITSCLAVIGLVITDITIPLYHTLISDTTPPLRPAYESYILFIIYIFLPLSKNWHCIMLGTATTVCYLVEMALITYANDELIIIKTITEFIFLFCVNFFGFYFRLMNEVAIRRAFLDRRECVEGNILLKFARDQEKNLLLSILPAHTAMAIEEDIRKMIGRIRNEKLAAAASHEISIKNFANLSPAPIPIQKAWRSPSISKLYVEYHTGVSVLYADVVNYTHMTTQLPVKLLVETLHELFVKFDQASEENNVLRIKFLGDCYYCVAGVPERNPQHAKSCVDLGLQMIRDIREVRATKNNLNIDMRIGIHSGSIMSGVIGACKWQYDIWSKDASIANRLESTGEPGKIHVSKQTLELLEDKYIYEPGTLAASKDEMLKTNGIESFLISPQYLAESNFYLPDDNVTSVGNGNGNSAGTSKRFSLGVKRIITRNSKLKLSRAKITPEGKPSIRRNFMHNSMEQYLEIMNQTNNEMACELDRMPIGKLHFHHYFSRSTRLRPSDADDNDNEEQQQHRTSLHNDVSTLLLCFKDRSWEWSFMRQPDFMLKYSTFLGLIIFIAILLMQTLNNQGGLLFWIINGISAMIFIIFIPITWFKKLWIIYISSSSTSSASSSSANDEDINTIKPTNKFCNYLYNLSRNIITNSVARTSIYLITMALLILCSLIYLAEHNDVPYPTNGTVFFTEESPMRNPWVITQSLLLGICLNFLFVRINFILKLFVGLMIVGIYSWLVFVQFYYTYSISSSINASLESNISHILIISFISLIFHMIDRQTEYISRVDYNWKQQLQRKQSEAEFTKDTINVLVQNILPAHVAEIYMSRQIKDELYYEEYENVAIMFATITNFDIQTDGPINTEKNILNILNRIICDFDEIIISQMGKIKIEKIKVAGWTYMVACGLDPGRADSSTSTSGFVGRDTIIAHRSHSLQSNGRRSWNTARMKPLKRLDTRFSVNNIDDIDEEEIITPSNRKDKNPVYVLAQFALEIMRSLKQFNQENFNSDGMLRIGIANGKVMAGVVGSKKPLYDIWGNAVNMASRMDSTGVSGKIQVTKETANELKSLGIQCEYRGNTFVKGRGTIPTYFVCINDTEMKFEMINNNSPNSSANNNYNQNNIITNSLQQNNVQILNTRF